MRNPKRVIATLLLFTVLLAALAAGAQQRGNPMVTLETNRGDIHIELFAEQAPASVNNFLRYVDDAHFDGTIFHRVIPGFMIQGGGFEPDMTQKPVRAPIVNEADNGLKNLSGTVAMARTNVVNSATAQFFINLGDNDFLNHGQRDFGYAVFGRVSAGMEVVNAIAATPTGRKNGHADVPLETIRIERALRTN